jgi:quercetin dioxygenase-like cupin family protein
MKITIRPTTAGPLAALAAVAISMSVIAAAAVGPASADTNPAPIAVEPLTPRSTFSGDVSVMFKMKSDHHGTDVVKLREPSRVVTARITIQPGARFPWHTHPGPVVVTVADGQLTYVDSDGCVERVYPAGSAFVDAGDHVHSAYGTSTGVTTLIATFFDVPATGPLTIPDTVQNRCS